MRRRGFISNHYGFTLIEIIAVLIILGILAAVAVPRYLDMTDDAHEAAVDGALSAGIANYNLAFAEYLADKKAAPTVIGDLTIETVLGDFTAAYAKEETDEVKVTISVTEGANVTWFTAYGGTKSKVIPAGVTWGEEEAP